MRPIGVVPMHPINISNLSCNRADNPILQGVNIEIQSGQVLRLTGPNGCGKSTFLKSIAGLLPIKQGTILLNQRALHAQDFIFLDHKPLMKSALTIAENLAFWSEIFQAPKMALDQAIQILGLYHLLHTPVEVLSCGQKKRAQLSTLYLKQSPLWLLDEPLLGLDDRHQVILGQMVQNHISDGGITLYASHEAIPGILDETFSLSSFAPTGDHHDMLNAIAA